MKKIGIIGAGNMGSGIAQKAAQEGFSVVIVDIKEEFVQRSINNIRSTLNEAVERRILKPEQAGEIMGRLKRSHFETAARLKVNRSPSPNDGFSISTSARPCSSTAGTWRNT